MPLKVIVVGAGIAGLCAAVSLRQAGHSVEIFEKSLFAAEIGAALHLSPNGSRVLSRLGFSFERARAQQLMVWESVDGTTLDQISTLDFRDAADRYGVPLMAVHRVDLHNELLRLALVGENAASLRLGAKVNNLNEEKGVIELDDGSVHQADLIIAADGLHSVLRSAVLKQDSKPSPTGLSAFRFLMPTKILESDHALRELLRWKAQGSTVMADTTDTVNERHLVWYSCQGGAVQNFVGIHPTRKENNDKQDPKTLMLQEFSHFHPDILKILRLSNDVKCWPLFVHEPLPSWIYGKVVLVGDAAHPMLPFGGQGSNQAMEDGGALGFLLEGVVEAADVSKRLLLFDKGRRKRASRVQILSKVRIGKEKEVQQELKLYAETNESLPTSFAERIAHDFEFDVRQKCDDLMQAHLSLREEEDIASVDLHPLAQTDLLVH